MDKNKIITKIFQKYDQDISQLYKDAEIEEDKTQLGVILKNITRLEKAKELWKQNKDNLTPEIIHKILVEIETN